MRAGIIACLLLLAVTSAAAAQATYRIIPEQSQASYAVDEVFFNENNRLFTAVGITKGVSGEVSINRDRLAESRIGEIVVDLHELKSDSERRDRALRGHYLDTNRYRYARLSAARLEQVPPSAREGVPFSFSLTGDLNLHGVTQRTTWRGEATLHENTLRATARTQVKMSSFGIEVPNLRALKSDDDVIIEIQFVATKQ